MDLEQLLAQCEIQLRSGRADQARIKLRGVSPGKIPDSLRLSYAHMCRRVGLISMGLKILTPPNVIDRDQWLSSAPLSDSLEFAVLLQQKGSVNKALHILEK